MKKGSVLVFGLIAIVAIGIILIFSGIGTYNKLVAQDEAVVAAATGHAINRARADAGPGRHAQEDIVPGRTDKDIASGRALDHVDGGRRADKGEGAGNAPRARIARFVGIAAGKQRNGVVAGRRHPPPRRCRSPSTGSCRKPVAGPPKCRARR